MVCLLEECFLAMKRNLPSYGWGQDNLFAFLWRHPKWKKKFSSNPQNLLNAIVGVIYLIVMSILLYLIFSGKVS